VDVISTLKVLTDVRAGTALTRLLTGVRWRLGVADLVALSERGFELARAEQARTSEGEPIGRPEPHLIDALDSLGDPARYSEAGYHRLTAFAHELTALRRRTDQPLPDLIEDIVRVSGLGAELAVRGGTARENLDRLVDEAARFASESAGSVPSFLSYLLAARAEDRGLETAEGRVSAERIQVLTVHGAKGLEWDVVAVPGLADGSFPAEPRGESWTNQRGKVPFELRGDAEALPVLQLGHATKPSEVNKTLTSFISSVNSHRLAEERRLAYVAMTRPRKALYCSGAVWSPGTKSPKKPSAYLVELRDLEPVTTVAGWYQPEPEEKNPLTSDIASMRWPAPLDAVQAADLRAAADLVTRAGADARDAGEGVKPAASRWTVEVDMLLAERRRRTRPERIDVAMPAQLSTSEAVALAEDPASFARRLRRPMPRQPSAAADRGSAFHSWLEQRFSSVALLDIDELFDLEPEAELATLRAAFLAGDWADRVPIAVEVGFELPIGAAIVRGRMDAVFADSDGGFTVVDWKTGRVPTGPDAQAKAVQLAAYRLAWARIKAIPDSEIERVRAAFYYVADNITVYPERLLDASGLRALIMPASPAADTAPGRLR
jgi:DNA helicase-2/ATP-dependent DNA helicase PcrA